MRKLGFGAGVLAGLLGVGGCDVFYNPSNENARCSDSSQCARTERCMIELEGNLYVSSEGGFIATDVGVYDLRPVNDLVSGPVRAKGELTAFPSDFEGRKDVFVINVGAGKVEELGRGVVFGENEAKGVCE